MIEPTREELMRWIKAQTRLAKSGDLIFFDAIYRQMEKPRSDNMRGGIIVTSGELRELVEALQKLDITRDDSPMRIVEFDLDKGIRIAADLFESKGIRYLPTGA